MVATSIATTSAVRSRLGRGFEVADGRVEASSAATLDTNLKALVAPQ